MSVRAAFKTSWIRAGLAICTTATAISPSIASAMPTYGADELWNGSTPWGGLGRVVGKSYVENHGIFSISFRWLDDNTIGKFTRYTSSNAVTEEHYRLQGSSVTLCDKTDQFCSPVHISKYMFSQTSTGGSKTAFTPGPHDMDIYYDSGTANASKASLDLVTGDPTGLADARAAEQQARLAQNEAEYEAFRADSAVAAQQNAASARETWDSIRRAATATNESRGSSRSHHGSVDASSTDSSGSSPSASASGAGPSGYCWYQNDGAPLYVSQVGQIRTTGSLDGSAVQQAWTRFLDAKHLLDHKRLQWSDGLPPRIPSCTAFNSRETAEKHWGEWSSSPTYLDFVPRD